MKTTVFGNLGFHLLDIEYILNNLFIVIPSYSIVFEGRESPQSFDRNYRLPVVR